MEPISTPSETQTHPPAPIQVEAEFVYQQNTVYWDLPHNVNGYLSNFYPSMIEIGDLRYDTVEHYFQSQKFVGTPQEIQVINSKTPDDAFVLGRKHKITRKQRWNDVKDSVMKAGLIAKFTQHEELRIKLINTGSQDMIEHWEDKYWSDGGGPGKGKNTLGRLLKEVRNELGGK